MFRMQELVVLAELNKGTDLDEIIVAHGVTPEKIEELKAKTIEHSQQYWVEGSKGRIRVNEVVEGRIRFTHQDHIAGTETEKTSKLTIFNLTLAIMAA